MTRETGIPPARHSDDERERESWNDDMKKDLPRNTKEIRAQGTELRDSEIIVSSSGINQDEKDLHEDKENNVGRGEGERRGRSERIRT